MARAHWRYIVRDQYGFVIQNAQVNVFQPGTSTAFTGSAFNAASGGSTITNPFTSNSQGEVEGWFDTPQVVDISVNDNSDTAYRAVNGAGSPISFTTFVEADQIFPAASDATNHGATYHTNIERKIYLHAEAATLGTGAAFVTVGTDTTASRTVEYSDLATETAFWTFNVPADFLSGALTVQPIWSPGATDGVAHTVRWSVTGHELSSGATVNAAGTTNAWTGASATRTIDVIVYDTGQTTITPTGANNVIRLALQRIGADGADTYVGTVRLHAIAVAYNASQ